MSNFLNPYEWQKLLFHSSDIIYEILRKNYPNWVQESTKDDYKKIHPLELRWANPYDTKVDAGPYSRGYLPLEKLETFQRQSSQLLSNSLINSGDAAKILFTSILDNDEDAEDDTKKRLKSLIELSNYSLNSFYETRFSFIFFNSDAEGKKKFAYKFPINTKKSINDNGLNVNNKSIHSPIIRKIEISNDSKDIEGISTMYTVNMEITFSRIEELIGAAYERIDMFTGKKHDGHLRFLEILYKNFGIGGISPSVIDGDGLGLLCEMELLEGSFIGVNEKETYNKIKEELGTTIFSKLLHLHYVKHDISLDSSPTPKTLHKLNITYTSYETDEQVKPAVSFGTPNYVYNMYNFLDDKRYNANLTNFYNESWISFASASKQATTDIETVTKLSNQVELLGASIDDKLRQKLVEGLEQKRQEISKFSFNLSNFLITTILNSCDVWGIQVPTPLIGVFSETERFTDFQKTFSGLAVQGATLGLSATTAAVALAAAPASAGFSLLLGAVGIGLGVGAAAVQAGISTWEKTVTRYRLVSMGYLREAFKSNFKDNNISIWNIGKNSFTEFKIATTAPKKESAGMVGKAQVLVQEVASTEQAQAKEQVEKKEASPEPEPGQITISKRFIFFKDIIKFLTIFGGDKNKTEVLCLNHFIETEGLTDHDEHRYSVINIAYLPISLENFMIFLSDLFINNQLINTVNISNERFFKEAYQKLIFNSISAAGNSDNIKNVIPTNMRYNVSIHKEELDLDKYKLLDDTDQSKSFRTLSKELLNTKVFTVGNFAGLKKVITIGELTKPYEYDYFTNYRTEQGGNLAPTFKAIHPTTGKLITYDTKNWFQVSFENFIAKNYYIPTIQAYAEGYRYPSIIKDNIVNLSRLDNPQLDTSNRLNSNSVFRQFYKLDNIKLWSYLWWFIDKGSNVFVAPASITGESQKNIFSENIFGWGGLYVVNSAAVIFNLASTSANPSSAFIPNIDDEFLISANQATIPFNKIKSTKAATTPVQTISNERITRPDQLPPDLRELYDAQKSEESKQKVLENSYSELSPLFHNDA